MMEKCWTEGEDRGFENSHTGPMSSNKKIIEKITLKIGSDPMNQLTTECSFA